MRPVVALTLGALAGMLISGLVASLAVVFLPVAWRGERVIWAGTAIILLMSIAIASRMAKPQRR